VGVKDVIGQLYPKTFTKITNEPIVHIFNEGDSVPTLDCQYGSVCTFKTSATVEDVHGDLVYGNEGWMFLQETETVISTAKCGSASSWSQTHGVCESQQEVVRNEFQLFAATIITGFLICWMIRLLTRKIYDLNYTRLTVGRL